MNKNITYIIEYNTENYHHYGKTLQYVSPDGEMFHISRIKEKFNIPTFDLYNQASSRDYMEANLILVPKDMRLAIYSFKIDHDLKEFNICFSLNSLSKDILEKIKEKNSEGALYKDYKVNYSFEIEEDESKFSLTEERINELLSEFNDNEHLLSDFLNKYENEVPFLENN